jgi:hypothetical protein
LAEGRGRTSIEILEQVAMIDEEEWYQVVWREVVWYSAVGAGFGQGGWHDEAWQE